MRSNRNCDDPAEGRWDFPNPQNDPLTPPHNMIEAQVNISLKQRLSHVDKKSSEALAAIFNNTMELEDFPQVHTKEHWAPRYAFIFRARPLDSECRTRVWIPALLYARLHWCVEAMLAPLNDEP
eukprot:7260131-Pyramimonas_sp.AAC.1